MWALRDLYLTTKANMAESQPPLKWSAQFAVSNAPRAHVLPGDKIALPQSALEQLLAAAASRNSANARQDMPAYDPFNPRAYSAYRRAEAEFQDHKQQLPYPLTFRLVNPTNGLVVYAGIQEFSAEEGEVALSLFLQESLGLANSKRGVDSGVSDIDDQGMPEANGALAALVTIHASEVPKGTYVKLRPLEAGYDPEDWKALLEQHLRQNFTTLTNGEILKVPWGKSLRGGKREEFRFMVDGFQPVTDGVCIVDTDLEVDIEALNEEQARETMKRIAEKMTRSPGTAQGSSAGQELDLFKTVEGQVLPGEYVDYQLPSWNRAEPIELELEGADDDEDVDLLVSPLSTTQRAKPRMDECVFAELDCRPTKRIRLEPSAADLNGAEALSISVHAFSLFDNSAMQSRETNEQSLAPRRFTLCARHPEAKATKKAGAANDLTAPTSEDDVQCKNCQQWVPKRTLMLHENFCLRNNMICPKGCGQVFQKRSIAFESHWHCPHDGSFGNTILSRRKHDALYHPPEVFRCNECNTQETFHSLPALARHRTTTCPAKLILCRFCHLEVPQEGDPDVPSAEALLSGMTPHELADGARTTECHLCSKIVRLRDMEIHLKNHDLDRASRPPPTPCRNINCGRTLEGCSKSGDTRAGTKMGQGLGNDIALCNMCFGPLYVNLNDPEGKALRRRIERKYLQQLLNGCVKAWCKNEFCKSGRKNLELSTNITTKDALPMVKPFIDGLASGLTSTPLHFCVDEASQKRRQLAPLLAAETAVDPTTRGGYGVDWCLGALEAESGNLDAARQWLKNWAPSAREEGRK